MHKTAQYLPALRAPSVAPADWAGGGPRRRRLPCGFSVPGSVDARPAQTLSFQVEYATSVREVSVADRASQEHSLWSGAIGALLLSNKFVTK